MFFMYFLYDLLAPIADRLDFGKQLLLAVKHLLLALHLIKGFSAEVKIKTAELNQNLICTNFIYANHCTQNVTGNASKKVY